jgi:hypothetical protein
MSVLTPFMDRTKRCVTADPTVRSQALRALSLKEEIVQQVGAGQLGLVTAAARFQAVNRQGNRAGCPPVPAVGPQGGEALCRCVIGWVQLALRDRPEQAEAVCGRLELELQDHLSRFGRVELSGGD